MILFNEIIFGPVNSRRLGISLGINLLPVNRKYCNFNCVYCECGLSDKSTNNKIILPTRENIKSLLIAKLVLMKENNDQLDAITFAGNGEPTTHPEFAGIIDDTIDARNIYYPNAAITVLSNATMLHKDSVFDALKKVEKNYLKIDSAIEETLIKINNPASDFKLSKVIENIKKFNGNFILQTMFLKGTTHDEIIDNTTETEIKAWLNVIDELRPKLVSIYSIQRVTPYASLKIISPDELDTIANKVRALGINVEVAK